MVWHFRVPLFKKCCGYVPVRKAALIIGYISLVLHTAFSLASIVMIGYGIDMYYSATVGDMDMIIGMFMIFSGIPMTAVNVLGTSFTGSLLNGIYKKKRSAMVPWMSLQSYGVIYVLGLSVSFFVAHILPSLMFPTLLFSAMFQSYCVAIVYSHYQELRIHPIPTMTATSPAQVNRGPTTALLVV